jgi:hypothetical protein
VGNSSQWEEKNPCKYAGQMKTRKIYLKKIRRRPRIAFEQRKCYNYFVLFGKQINQL